MEVDESSIGPLSKWNVVSTPEPRDVCNNEGLKRAIMAHSACQTRISRDEKGDVLPGMGGLYERRAVLNRSMEPTRPSSSFVIFVMIS